MPQVGKTVDPSHRESTQTSGGSVSCFSEKKAGGEDVPKVWPAWLFVLGGVHLCVPAPVGLQRSSPRSCRGFNLGRSELGAAAPRRSLEQLSAASTGASDTWHVGVSSCEIKQGKDSGQMQIQKRREADDLSKERQAE